MCAGCKSLGLKIHPSKGTAKYFFNLSVPLPRFILRSDRGRERPDFHQRRKGLPVPLWFPHSRSFKMQRCAAHHPTSFTQSTMVRLTAVVPHEENRDALYQPRGSRAARDNLKADMLGLKTFNANQIRCSCPFTAASSGFIGYADGPSRVIRLRGFSSSPGHLGDSQLFP
jgi:hypothetical protein